MTRPKGSGSEALWTMISEAVMSRGISALNPVKITLSESPRVLRGAVDVVLNCFSWGSEAGFPTIKDLIWGTICILLAKPSRK